MTQKSAGRQARDARLQQIADAPPEAQGASFVLNSPEIPTALMDFMKQAFSQQVVITLFPFVRTYSSTLSPLEFGKALQMVTNAHGQIRFRYVTSFDRKKEVIADAESGIISDVEEIRDLWKAAFEESWKALTESEESA